MSIRNGMPAADLTEVSWRKSRRSGPQGGNCVEVANLPDGQVAVRNSRVEQGSLLVSGSSQASTTTPVTITDDVIDGGLLSVNESRTANGSTPVTVSRNQVLNTPGIYTALQVTAGGSGASTSLGISAQLRGARVMHSPTYRLRWRNRVMRPVTPVD